MFASDGGSFKTLLSIARTSVTAAAFAAAAVGATATAFIHSEQFRPAVTVSLEPLAWWTQLQYGFDHNPEPPKSETVVAALTPAHQEKPKRHPVKRLKTVDRLLTTAAQSTPAPNARSVHQRLEGVYRQLHSRFLLALNTHQELNTQILIAEVKPAIQKSRPKAVVRTHFQKKRVAKVVQAEKREVVEMASQVTPHVPPAPSLVKVQEPQQVADRLVAQQSAPDHAEPVSAEPILEIQKVVAAETAHSRVLQAEAQPQPQIKAEGRTDGPQAQLPTSLLAATQAVTTQLSSAESSVRVAEPDYSQKRSEQAVTTQKSEEGADYSSPTSQAFTATSHGAPQTPEVVEAFDWETPVSLVTRNVVSSEGFQSKQGWVYFSSPAHWPTLAWTGVGPGTTARARSVSLVSENAALILSKISGTALMNGTGIIFGRVAQGHGVEFSGRADSVLYFNEQKQLTQASAPGPKHFALINAAPGAHLIYTTSLSSGERDGTAVYVQAHTATQVDLDQRVATQLSGRVYDGSATRAKPLAGINVRVVGQPGVSVLTDARGFFRLTNVSVFDGRPLFIESEGKTGFTHRYKVSQGKYENLALFRMGDRQINTWVSQLEGGMSPESGLLVAAVPEAVAKARPSSVFPRTYALGGNSTLRPESYSLLSDGRLMENVELAPESPRFVAAQIPEGPVVTVLETKQQRVVWSDLFVASPGVVNVVGP